MMQELLCPSGNGRNSFFLARCRLTGAFRRRIRHAPRLPGSGHWPGGGWSRAAAGSASAVPVNWCDGGGNEGREGWRRLVRSALYAPPTAER